MAQYRRVQAQGALMVLIAAASWGTWSLVLRPTHMPATLTSPIIFLMMGIACLPLCLGPSPMLWDRRTTWLLLASSACDALNVLAFFAAMEHTTVAIAVLTHYLTPVLVAVAARWLEADRAPGVLQAALIALGGLVLVLAPWQANAVGLWGPLLGVISAFCYTGNVFLMKRLSRRLGAWKAMGYHAVIAGVLLLPLAWADLGNIRLDPFIRLGIASFSIGALAGVAFVTGLSRIGAARASTLTYAEPLVAVGISVGYWHEPLPTTAFLGGAIILATGLYTIRASAKS